MNFLHINGADLMRLYLVAIVLFLVACSDENHVKSDSKQPTNSPIQVPSSITTVSSVAAVLELKAASGVSPTSDVSSTQPSSGVYVAGNIPSSEIITSWWKKKSNVGINVDNVKQIGLLNHEVAFIASATFDDAGRNGMFGAVLIRPTLQEVHDLRESVGSEFEIYDLDNDGVSEVVTKVSGSGQGTEIGDKLIVLFDEWNPVVLHQVHFETGMNADLTAGTEETIEWKLVPKSNTEKYAKLIEAIYINDWTQGANDKHPKNNIHRENNTYKFLNKKFE